MEVTVRNLPNDAKNEDILEYLEIAGPIKTYKFVREEERCTYEVTQTAPSSPTTTTSRPNSARSTWLTDTSKGEHSPSLPKAKRTLTIPSIINPKCAHLRTIWGSRYAV